MGESTALNFPSILLINLKDNLSFPLIILIISFEHFHFKVFHFKGVGFILRVLVDIYVALQAFFLILFFIFKNKVFKKNIDFKEPFK